VVALLLAATPWIAHAQTTVRMVPQANLAILDPIWTTANVTRHHGYMIYDTLFGTDAKGEIKPQMVDKWSVSSDKKIWTFTLRDGLAFHDGKPVTAEDVVQSLTRWSARDGMGVVMRTYLDKFDAVDAKTFRIVYNTPFGLTLEALGKEGSPAFIMPKRIAETPASEQIKESIGSGPYVFKADEFKPGERAVYVKNEKYVPRKEAPSGTAGGKLVFVDRVEWVIIRDPQTQLNALKAGEVDMIEQPAAEQYATLRSSPGITLVNTTPSGASYGLRFNFLNPPFNNVLLRRAAMLALGQDQVLRTQVASPGMYRFCKSVYPCGTKYESDNTGIYTGVANPEASKKLLQEAGYKGQPVLLMRPSDFAALAKAPLVIKQQLEAGGFVVDMQTMDWQTLLTRRAKKDPAAAGGWDAFVTFFPATDSQSPMSFPAMNARGAQGWVGWQDDPELEEIKKKFAAATTDAEKKKQAEAAALRSIESVTHVNLGQFSQPAAVRSNVTGFVPTGVLALWNIKKTP
jgi:peptide/nickel transport system substrate-binding protein